MPSRFSPARRIPGRLLRVALPGPGIALLTALGAGANLFTLIDRQFDHLRRGDHAPLVPALALTGRRRPTTRLLPHGHESPMPTFREAATKAQPLPG